MQETTILGKDEQFRQPPFVATERPVACDYLRFEQMRQERIIRGLLTRGIGTACEAILGQAADLPDLIGGDDLVEPLQCPGMSDETACSNSAYP